MSRLSRFAVGLLLLAAQALAAPRAWVDRDRVALDETLTLNVEAEGGQAPDFEVLRNDFELLGQSSQTSTTISNGSVRTSTLWAVALQPRRVGTLRIPAFTLAGTSTAPIEITVTVAKVGADALGRDLFIEVEVDDDKPYVGQPVLYTLRLNYAITLLNGDLDAPSADGIDVRRIGDDKSYQREIAGRRYQTLERQFLLTPERSGAIDLAPPRFRGQALGAARSALFGGSRALTAMGASIHLDVRAQPAGAGSPWLPARAVRLRYLDPPLRAKVGVPLSVQLQLEVDGVSAAQISDLQLPPIAGARVFPDRAQSKEQIRDGYPSTAITRRFAIVPSAPGILHIPAITVPWWNVIDDRGEQAQAAGFTLEVGAAATPAPVVGSPLPTPSPDAPTLEGGARLWPALSLLFAILWLATLGWHLHMRRARVVAAPDHALVPGAVQYDRATLRRALATGDLAAIDAVLMAAAAMAGHQLPDALAEPSQRAAYDALQRARWRGDDPDAARNALRVAFAKEIVWRSEGGHAAATTSPLPPLWRH